jgi:hypothetical protein
VVEKVLRHLDPSWSARFAVWRDTPTVVPATGDVDGSEKSLWTVILYATARAIDLHAVAQTLLIRAGKWAPNNDERPEPI